MKIFDAILNPLKAEIVAYGLKYSILQQARSDLKNLVKKNPKMTGKLLAIDVNYQLIQNKNMSSTKENSGISRLLKMIKL